jgi:hypothetical protein
MNRWNIPRLLEEEILARDTACIHCGVDFSFRVPTRGARPSCEHIVNDAKNITRENIARCCMSCNASKGTKDIEAWLLSKYCERKGINKNTVAEIVRNVLAASSRLRLCSPGGKARR